MRKHRGLTLVKFLVVLSIVAIMVRLLIPAVPYAQKAANVTVGKKNWSSQILRLDDMLK